MFGTDGGHLDEEAVDQFDAVVRAKDSSVAELVILPDRELPQGHFWFCDRAVENRRGHGSESSRRDWSSKPSIKSFCIWAVRMPGTGALTGMRTGGVSKIENENDECRRRQRRPGSLGSKAAKRARFAYNAHTFPPFPLAFFPSWML